MSSFRDFLTGQFTFITTIMTNACAAAEEVAEERTAWGEKFWEEHDKFMEELRGFSGSATRRYSLINESIGVTDRDLTYGNPAKALDDIRPPFTGNIQESKDALRDGDVRSAQIAAGEWIYAISQKISALIPKLSKLVDASQAKISVADVIDEPLKNAMDAIGRSMAISDLDRHLGMNELLAFQQTVHRGLGETATRLARKDMSPEEALRIKRELSGRVTNWAEPREIEEAFQSVYRSLAQAIHLAVPGSATVDEQLTHALAAKQCLERVMRNEKLGTG